MTLHRLRTAVAVSGLLAGGLGLAPAHAAPIYPMLFLTISAPAGLGAPTYTIDAQAPAGWQCGALSWVVSPPGGTGTATVSCSPPVAPMGFENTCVWNVAKVLSTGVSGNLYGQSFCETNNGAAVSTGVPGTNVFGTAVNVQFKTATCRAIASPVEQLVRPWTVRCSINH